MNERVDQMGAVASSVCALHCALCALLPVALSAVGLGVLISHEAEWAFTVVAIVFALGAMVLGWRQHGSVPVVGLLALGIVGLLASRGLEMMSEHDDHHDGHHAGAHESAEPDKPNEGSQPSGAHAASDHPKEEDHHGHADAGHLFGAVVGVLAGL